MKEWFFSLFYFIIEGKLFCVCCCCCCFFNLQDSWILIYSGAYMWSPKWNKCFVTCHLNFSFTVTWFRLWALLLFLFPVLCVYQEYFSCFWYSSIFQNNHYFNIWQFTVNYLVSKETQVMQECHNPWFLKLSSFFWRGSLFVIKCCIINIFKHSGCMLLTKPFHLWGVIETLSTIIVVFGESLVLE